MDLWGSIQGSEQRAVMKMNTSVLLLPEHSNYIYTYIYIYVYMYFPLLIVFLQPFYLLLGLNEQYLCLQFLFFVMFLLVFFLKRQDSTHIHTERERENQSKRDF